VWVWGGGGGMSTGTGALVRTVMKLEPPWKVKEALLD
jgi:hypothetical protein